MHSELVKKIENTLVGIKQAIMLLARLKTPVLRYS